MDDNQRKLNREAVARYTEMFQDAAGRTDFDGAESPQTDIETVATQIGFYPGGEPARRNVGGSGWKELDEALAERFSDTQRRAQIVAMLQKAAEEMTRRQQQLHNHALRQPRQVPLIVAEDGPWLEAEEFPGLGLSGGGKSLAFERFIWERWQPSPSATEHDDLERESGA